MAGPAIRAYEMACFLSRKFDVTLASTHAATIDGDGFDIEDVSEVGLPDLVQDCDVLIFQGHLLEMHPWIADTDVVLVADLYDPMHLEHLEESKQHLPEFRFGGSVNAVRALNRQMTRADFMICASEKQRDFWLGALATLGRVNPITYDADESLRSLIDVVPFGVPDQEPDPQKAAIKGQIEGIGAEDKVVLWGGGIYNWFDPLTLIRAIDQLSRRQPTVRLFFLGVTHPNSGVAAHRMALEAQNLASELGLTNRFVFFNEGWVPYAERVDYLCDADVGVSTHLDHLETSYSFRTRILDYLWAGLPIVSTAGDTFGALITEHRLGRTVPANDVDALTEALEKMLYDEAAAAEARENVRDFRRSMRWSTALEPLLRFCESGGRAGDLVSGETLVVDVDVKAREARIDDLAKRIDGLESSSSWKLTRPLRAVTQGIRRVMGRQ